MKEYVQQPGIRRWYGDELTELQSQVLNPLQDFLSQYGDCVLQGAEVIATGAQSPTGSLYGIGKGLIGMNTSDGYKIATLAAIPSTLLPLYVNIQKSTVNATYENDPLGNPGPFTNDGAYDYEAVVSGTPPAGNYLTITPSGISPDFVAAFYTRMNGAWQTINFNNGNATGTISYRKLGAMNCLQLKGSINVQPSSSTPHNPPFYYSSSPLPVGYRPLIISPFKCFIRYGTISGNNYIKDVTDTDYIKDINGDIDTDGTISFGLISSQGNISYSIYFNEIIPLG
jgi:hypothetical protein